MVDIKAILGNYFSNMSKVQFNRVVNYTSQFNKEKVNDKIIFYESFHGDGMNDNPFAIFKYLINNAEYKNYIHIWSLKETQNNGYVEHYSKFKNVKFIEPYSKQYYKYLSSAKYIIHNVTLPPFFIKKKEQVYINTWHGTPLKTLGNDMVGAVTQNYNVQRNFLQTNFILSPNNFTTDKLVYSYGIDKIYQGEVLENGYPRIDSIFNSSDIIAEFLFENKIEKEKKLVLYAPTWRGQKENIQNTAEELFEKVKSMVKLININEYQIILKVHHLVYEYAKDIEMDGIVFIPDWIDTNELLYFVDILITDYSSIFFDFLVKDKPIIFFAYDRVEYEETRGLYLDIDHLPGQLCMNEEEVAYFINNSSTILDNNKEVIKEFKDRFVPYDDGNVTKKYVEYIFKNENTIKNSLKFSNGKPNIVVYGGAFLNNGITSSLINLSWNLDYDKYNLIVVDKNSGNEDFLRNIHRLSPETRIIFRGGIINLTYNEWIKYHKIFNDCEIDNIPSHKQFVDREWHRLLGETPIDIAIDFGGYSPFWSYMMSLSNAKKKIIYQHNDMWKESEKNVNGNFVHQKNLSIIFQLYKYFDIVASVGKRTMEYNIENLKKYVSKDKFVYLPNLLDKKYLYAHRFKSLLREEAVFDKTMLVLNKEEEFGSFSLNAITSPIKNGKNFITIGRLSPEKDQSKLLFSFKKILQQHGLNHLLYIVGSGQDEEKLKVLTRRLQLENNVIFTGQTPHAMELLDMCDCFVFPSNHEGQPMTLLECLALEKPIIATDIPGNRSVLTDKNGMLVENSIEGLVDGMNRFLNGEVIETNFSVDKYNEEALDKFYSVLDTNL